MSLESASLSVGSNFYLETLKPESISEVTYEPKNA